MNYIPDNTPALFGILAQLLGAKTRERYNQEQIGNTWGLSQKQDYSAPPTPSANPNFGQPMSLGQADVKTGQYGLPQIPQSQTPPFLQGVRGQYQDFNDPAFIAAKLQLPEDSRNAIDKQMMFGMPKYTTDNAGGTQGVWTTPAGGGKPTYEEVHRDQTANRVNGEWTVPDVPEERKNPAGGWERKMIKKDASGNTYTKWESMNEPPSTGGSMYTAGTQDDIEESAKAVSNYEADLNAIPRQDKTRVLSRARQLNPKWNQINYNANRQLKQQYTSGKYAQNITSLNTAIGHLGDFLEAGEALKNGDLRVVNYVANALGRQGGSSLQDAFAAVKDALANELATTFKGSSGTDIGTAGIMQTMSEAQSPEQIVGVARMYAKLLQSRLEALNSNYKKQTGLDFPVLDEEKKLVIDKIMSHGEAQEENTDVDSWTDDEVTLFNQNGIVPKKRK